MRLYGLEILKFGTTNAMRKERGLRGFARPHECAEQGPESACEAAKIARLAKILLGVLFRGLLRGRLTGLRVRKGVS